MKEEMGIADSGTKGTRKEMRNEKKQNGVIGDHALQDYKKIQIPSVLIFFEKFFQFFPVIDG